MNTASGSLWPGEEAALGSRALALSVAVHLLAAAVAIVWPLWQGPRLDLSQVFVVSLVSEPGLPAGGDASAGRAELVAEPPQAPEPPSKAELKAVEEVPPAAPKKAEAKKAEATEKPPSADERLAEEMARLRDRVQRDTALNQALAQLRGKRAQAGSPGGDNDVVSQAFAGGEVPLAFKLYYQQVWDRIQKHWALPSRQSGLTAVVSLRIARDGSVDGVELESGSGDARFDRSVLNAVRASNPLPPLPGDYMGRWHEVGIRFRQ
jgi:colicin import membrane protein